MNSQVGGLQQLDIYWQAISNQLDVGGQPGLENNFGVPQIDGLKDNTMDQWDGQISIDNSGAKIGVRLDMVDRSMLVQE